MARFIAVVIVLFSVMFCSSACYAGLIIQDSTNEHFLMSAHAHSSAQGMENTFVDYGRGQDIGADSQDKSVRPTDFQKLIIRLFISMSVFYNFVLFYDLLLRREYIKNNTNHNMLFFYLLPIPFSFLLAKIFGLL